MWILAIFMPKIGTANQFTVQKIDVSYHKFQIHENPPYLPGFAHKMHEKHPKRHAWKQNPFNLLNNTIQSS